MKLKFISVFFLLPVLLVSDSFGQHSLTIAARQAGPFVLFPASNGFWGNASGVSATWRYSPTGKYSVGIRATHVYDYTVQYIWEQGYASSQSLEGLGQARLRAGRKMQLFAETGLVINSYRVHLPRFTSIPSILYCGRNTAMPRSWSETVYEEGLTSWTWLPGVTLGVRMAFRLSEHLRLETGLNEYAYLGRFQYILESGATTQRFIRNMTLDAGLQYHW